MFIKSLLVWKFLSVRFNFDQFKGTQLEQMHVMIYLYKTSLIHYYEQYNPNYYKIMSFFRYICTKANT